MKVSLDGGRSGPIYRMTVIESGSGWLAALMASAVVSWGLTAIWGHAH